MNKKFLSAILFGALMVTSTGTFVSCKDYDDDIENLQGQISANKDAIAKLQQLVGAGNWVTNIAGSEAGLVVTMNNGSSTTIPTVNGKNGTEWTIGTDGYWYKDGEKTANVAIGKDGVTAPSPKIENGYWVVYNWDAEKSEFVAETTEVPAAGTSAYVVEANGAYTLFVADENGEMVEVVLPATCDSFVMTAPYATIKVEVEHAVWGKTGRDPKEYAALLAAFPEIADHKTNDKLIQGGELPVLVNPMELELDNSYTFQLVDLKGKIANIELTNPTKGIAEDWKIENGAMSRSAEEGGLWTLEAAPLFDRKEGYGSITNGSLVATNAKGISSRTAFAYNVAKKTTANTEVTVTPANLTVDYAEDGIDVLAAVYGADKKSAIFTLGNEYYGKYILEATNKLQVEKYGLTTEGSKLYIANMPANETTIKVTLKMTALGLNGSTASNSATITVQQTIVASEGLTPKTVTLNKKAQEVRWDVEELGLSAVEMHNFLRAQITSNSHSANTINFVVTREADKYYKETGAADKLGQDGETELYVAFNAAAKFYNAKGKQVEYVGDGVWVIVNTNTVSEVATIGFDVDATAAAPDDMDSKYIGEKWNADTYQVSLTSKNGNVVIFAAGTELTVENPAIDETFVKLVPAFVQDGVYQITGLAAGGHVTYGIDNALITNNGADAVEFYDMDYTEYVENGGDDEEDYGFYNWIETAAAADASVSVSTWAYEEDWTDEDTPWIKAMNNQLYVTRNIRAMISLFNNPENVVPFDFQIVVKSEIYSEDASSVTVDATKLKGTFTDTDASTTVDTREIKLADAFTAKIVAGDEAGKAYNLFATEDKTGNGTSTDYTNYKIAGDYVLGDDGNLIKFSVTNAIKMQQLSGMTISNNGVDYTDSKNVYNLKIDDWTRLWTVTNRYYNNGTLSAITKTVKYQKWEENSRGEEVLVYKVKKQNGIDYDKTSKPIMVEKTVYSFLYELNKSQIEGQPESVTRSKLIENCATIPADDAKYIELFNAYKVTVSAKETTITGGGSTTPGTPRDARIASVQFVFDDAEEADKFFTNTISAEGVVFTDAYAEDAVLVADEAAQVDVIGGKVVVGMKAYITDVWGMTMVVPFNVEVSTK